MTEQKRTIELAKSVRVLKEEFKMLNAVGREIPDEILKLTGKEPFQGNNYKKVLSTENRDRL